MLLQPATAPPVEKTQDESTEKKDADYRYDVVLWLFGMLFLCVLICLMFGIGKSINNAITAH